MSRTHFFSILNTLFWVGVFVISIVILCRHLPEELQKLKSCNATLKTYHQLEVKPIQPPADVQRCSAMIYNIHLEFSRQRLRNY